MVACGLKEVVGDEAFNKQQQQQQLQQQQQPPPPPCFDNPKDEATYWKQVAHNYAQNLHEVKEEFEEFQEGSRELEAELETQLQQYENQVNDLSSTKCNLENENEKLKEKLDNVQRTSNAQVTSLQDENVQVKTLHDEMLKYIRELEQKNDDLERAKRVTISSLASFDVRLNNALERNAFLETELEDKEQLMVTVQRLKDESRDLKSELRRNSVDSSKEISNVLGCEAKLRFEGTTTCQKGVENKKEYPLLKGIVLPSEVGEPNPHPPPPKNDESLNSLINNPTTTTTRDVPSLTPSARISALNIVSDLLRKVGALESKLANCRTFVERHPAEAGGGGVVGVGGVGGGPSQFTTTTSSDGGIVDLNDLSDVNGLISGTNRVESSRRISGLVKVNV